jgi:hypothetical protein
MFPTSYFFHSSGNGVAVVDDMWFEKAPTGTVLGVQTFLIPAEELVSEL